MEVMEPPVNLIKFPYSRVDVRSAVEALSDPDYQWRVWIRHEYPHERFYDDLTMNVHILFDDWMVLPDAEEAVGASIYADEAGPLHALGEVFDPLITHLGNVTDERYITDSRWPEIVRRAKVALDVMRRNDEEFGTGLPDDVG